MLATTEAGLTHTVGNLHVGHGLSHWSFLPCLTTVLNAGNKDESAQLASTVLAVLREASRWGMQSVAMPLIGAGAAGWPPKLAADIHIAQLLELASGTSSITLKVQLLPAAALCCLAQTDRHAHAV